MEIFWTSHNACERAWSRQYMSAVFYHDDAQRRTAEAVRDRLAAPRSTVRTPILPLVRFYVAEDYHQKYALRSTPRVMSEFDAFYPDPVAFRDSTAAARANGFLAGNGTPADLDALAPSLGLSPDALSLLRQRAGRR